MPIVPGPELLVVHLRLRDGYRPLLPGLAIPLMRVDAGSPSTAQTGAWPSGPSFARRVSSARPLLSRPLRECSRDRGAALQLAGIREALMWWLRTTGPFRGGTASTRDSS